VTKEKFSRDHWREAWIAAKTENPLLSRAEFAQAHGVSTRGLAFHLQGLEADDRETLSRFIANRIEECAKEHNKAPADLTWYVFRDWAKVVFGSNDKGITSHHITMAGGFNRIRDAYFPVNPTKQAVERKIVQTHALYNRRLGSTLAQREWLAESLESYVERVFKGRVTPSKRVTTKAKATKRLVHSVWSDLHFGANVKGVETGAFDYGCKAEARRFGHLVSEIADYKPQYRDTSELMLWILGDVMQGHLHPGDAARHAEQMARCIHLLTQGIAYLAGCYARVQVKCVPGNHGRNKQTHHDRATDQKWDSHETVIYYATKAALSRLPNVEIEVPRTPYVLGEAFGAGMFGTHFDTVMDVGFAGKNVPTGSILNQINQMNMDWMDNARERGLEHVPCQVFIGGHTHSPLLHHTSGGRTLIVNGALVPPDGFSVGAVGRMATGNGQWVWEQVEGFPVGDARFVRVGWRQDEDAALEKVIRPWSGEF
jgi:hypothetical protein